MTAVDPAFVAEAEREGIYFTGPPSIAPRREEDRVWELWSVRQFVGGSAA